MRGDCPVPRTRRRFRAILCTRCSPARAARAGRPAGRPYAGHIGSHVAAIQGDCPVPRTQRWFRAILCIRCSPARAAPPDDQPIAPTLDTVEAMSRGSRVIALFRARGDGSVPSCASVVLPPARPAPGGRPVAPTLDTLEAMSRRCAVIALFRARGDGSVPSCASVVLPPARPAPGDRPVASIDRTACTHGASIMHLPTSQPCPAPISSWSIYGPASSGTPAAS